MVKKCIMETFLNNLCSQGIKGEFLNSQSAIAEFSFQWSCHFEQQSGNLNSLNLKQASYLSDTENRACWCESPNPLKIWDVSQTLWYNKLLKSRFNFDSRGTKVKSVCRLMYEQGYLIFMNEDAVYDNKM